MTERELKIQFAAELLSLMECPENLTRQTAEAAYAKYLEGKTIEDILAEIE